MRRLLRITAQEAERIIRTSSGLKAAQTSLANTAAQAWRGIGDATEAGIGDAVTEALQFTALADEDLMARSGMSSRAWQRSQVARAQAGADALISRKVNDISLSQRVWRDTQTAQRGLNQTIDSGLLLGKTPRDIAKDVSKYINPDVPGGMSYAAMRLGRSEVLNAYHQTSVRKYQETPWVEKVKWNLSGSHAKPDECNEYAAHKPYDPMMVPDKPHPNCLCYITPVEMNLERYAQKFESGQFDDYIEEQMGCVRYG
jgi:hypothetical protein